MKRIYHLSTCGTCRRILSELENIEEFELVNVRERHVTAEELEQIAAMSGLSYEKLLNKRAQKYRSLDITDFTEADFKKVILQEYTLLKRPIIIVDDQIFVGNSKKTIEAAKTLINKS